MNLSWVLDLFGNAMPITGDTIIDTLLFAGIGAVAFYIAWKVGGQIECSSALMSIVHWAVRIVGFIILWAVFVGIYWLIRFIASIPWWVWIIIGVVLIHLIVGIVLLVKFFKKKKAKKSEEKDKGQD